MAYYFVHCSDRLSEGKIILDWGSWSWRSGTKSGFCVSLPRAPSSFDFQSAGCIRNGTNAWKVQSTTWSTLQTNRSDIDGLITMIDTPNCPRLSFIDCSKNVPNHSYQNGSMDDYKKGECSIQTKFYPVWCHLANWNLFLHPRCNFMTIPQEKNTKSLARVRKNKESLF